MAGGRPLPEERSEPPHRLLLVNEPKAGVAAGKRPELPAAVCSWTM